MSQPEVGLLLPSKATPTPSCLGLGRLALPLARVWWWLFLALLTGSQAQSALQASPFTAGPLIRLAGIRCGAGVVGPLKGTNKSSQVLEGDLGGCDLESVSGEANKPPHGSTSWVPDTGPSSCGLG